MGARHRQSDRSPVQTLGANLGWGAACGLGVALLFSVFVAILAVFRGSTSYDGGRVTTWKIVSSYLGTGLGAGLLLGLLRPLARGRLGGGMVGAVVGALVYSAVVIGLDGWEKFDPTISILLGVLVGGTVGYQLGKGVP